MCLFLTPEGYQFQQEERTIMKELWVENVLELTKFWELFEILKTKIKRSWWIYGTFLETSPLKLG
jgi:hypothetical protein